MAKPGPKGPSKPMDDRMFEQLVAMIRIQCTRDEIIDILKMSSNTINRRLKDRGAENFDTLFKKHSSEGKASLRRSQWLLATEKLNPTMLVWLGKQMLGQRDAPEEPLSSRQPVTIQFIQAGDDDGDPPESDDSAV